MSLLAQWFSNINVYILTHPQGLVKNTCLDSIARIPDLMRQESAPSMQQGKGVLCENCRLSMCATEGMAGGVKTKSWGEDGQTRNTRLRDKVLAAGYEALRSKVSDGRLAG